MMETSYRVELEQFTGPLDLLLHLLREHELAVGEIRVAEVCDRYLEHLEELDTIDLDAAGEFLVMASILMRLKSRSLLPSDELALEEEDLDPRFELVRQLIEYRRFRRAADFLAWRRAEAARRFPRGGWPELRELRDAPRETETVVDTTVDDLFAAFGRLLRETQSGRAYVITKDDTPMEVHLGRLETLLSLDEAVPFRTLFAADASRAYVIGVFLALLELMKRGRAIVLQSGAFGDIVVQGANRPWESEEPETEAAEAADD